MLHNEELEAVKAAHSHTRYRIVAANEATIQEWLRLLFKRGYNY